MHRTGLVLLVAAGALAASRGAEKGGANPVSHPSHSSPEQVRLRGHFDSALVELRARDFADLTANRRAARSELTTWLAEYRDAGRFPLNDRYSDSLTPIFRDAHGVTCAMAYLIERSGRRDIVDRVARTRNLAYIGELADDPALVAWLDSVGFDVAEAARVQPTYPSTEPQRKARWGYAAASLVMSGVSVATTTSNVFDPNEVVGFMGVITGGITILAGSIPHYDQNSSRGFRAVGSVGIVAGGAAVVAGMYALFRPRSRAPATSPGPDQGGVSWAIQLDPGLPNAYGARPIHVGLAGRF